MTRLVDYACFKTAILWPGPWPANRIADMILCRAGRYAYGAQESML